MDIEPCPFPGCGRPAQIGEWSQGSFMVTCTNETCGATGPWRPTEAEAIAAWNHVAGQRWQPIETAPRDGTSVFLWWPYWSGHPVSGHCLSSGQWQSRAALSSEGDEPGPTHWRPALEPPEPPPIQTSGYVELIGKETLT